MDIMRLLGIKRNLDTVMAANSWSVVDLFLECVKTNPDGDAMHFIDDGTTYTYREMDAITNQGAPRRFLLEHLFPRDEGSAAIATPIPLSGSRLRTRQWRTGLCRKVLPVVKWWP